MQELTTADFSSKIGKGSIVVDFWAPWCGPCKIMAPVFEEAAKSHGGVTFAKVNVDENGEIAQQLGIRGIPTIVFFRNGQEVTRVTGAMNKGQLEAKLKDAFK
jgi:thioredoxin